MAQQSVHPENKSSPTPDILIMDFDEIDRILLGPGAWDGKRIATPYPVASTKTILKKFSPLFR